ncbi:MAG: DUF190 domain-containing protein [Cyanobacteria bacterium SZAS LIN-3]|nr:DUF190 domain-containing protein [Cyanobacteria bacterium SZAS LIN-3]MBS2005433.1 DUF190 domain-containing protein [Cyanobacteria bacterium SZAS TMP-1]
MTTSETMQRLMIFIDETDKYGGGSLSSALIEKLRIEGISGATVMTGVAGFGSHGMVHTTAILDLASAMPQVIWAIDTVEKVQAVLPKLQEMMQEGLIIVDDVEAVKISRGKQDGGKSTQQITASMQLQADAKTHTVAEYMDKTPITIKPGHTVADIIPLMINHGRAILPVVNDQGNLLGTVHSEDLLRHMLNVRDGGFHFFGMRGKEQKQFTDDIKKQSVSEVMRSSPPVVQEETSMLKAAQLMLNQKIKALPVVHGQTLVGVLRLPDVLKIALDIECEK